VAWRTGERVGALGDVWKGSPKLLKAVGFLGIRPVQQAVSHGTRGGGRDARNMEVTCEHEGEGEKARREELACCET
jgi:hypothetical protein